jgi:hypothetical protein
MSENQLKREIFRDKYFQFIVVDRVSYDWRAPKARLKSLTV